MPKCKPCLAAEVKEAILKEFGNEVKGILASIPDCQSPELINLCGGKKRAKSAYNIFISSCIRGKSSSIPVTERMKECGRDWKQQKKS